MAIQIATNFELNGAMAIDSRNVVGSLSSITEGSRYEGMIVYQISDSKYYKYVSGAFIDKDTEIKATLATKADISYVDTQIGTIGNGSPKGVYATLVALQAAFPTGTTGIYVVSADGHWYYWGGSAWVDGGVYQATGIVDGSITYPKLAEVAKTSISEQIGIDRIKTPAINLVYGGDGNLSIDSILSHTGDEYFYGLDRGNTILNVNKQFEVLCGVSGTSFYFYRINLINDLVPGKYMSFAAKLVQNPSGSLVNIAFRNSANGNVQYNGQNNFPLPSLGDGWVGLQNVLIPATAVRVEFRFDGRTATNGATLIFSDVNACIGSWLFRGGVIRNSVTTNSILDDSITTPKILDSAITTTKIAPNAITSEKISATTKDSMVQYSVDSDLLSSVKNLVYGGYAEYSRKTVDDHIGDTYFKANSGNCIINPGLDFTIPYSNTVGFYTYTLNCIDLLAIGESVSVAVKVSEDHANFLKKIEFQDALFTSVNYNGNSENSLKSIGNGWYVLQNIIIPVGAIYLKLKMDARTVNSGTVVKFTELICNDGKIINTFGRNIKNLENVTRLQLFPDPLLKLQDWMNFSPVSGAVPTPYIFSTLNGEGFLKIFNAKTNLLSSVGYDFPIIGLKAGDLISLETNITELENYRLNDMGIKLIFLNSSNTEISRGSLYLDSVGRKQMTITIPALTEKIRIRFDVAYISTNLVANTQWYIMSYLGLCKVEDVSTRHPQIPSVYAVRRAIDLKLSTADVTTINTFTDPLILAQDWLNYGTAFGGSNNGSFETVNGLGRLKIQTVTINTLHATGHDALLNTMTNLYPGDTLRFEFEVVDSTTSGNASISRGNVIAYDVNGVELSRGTTEFIGSTVPFTYTINWVIPVETVKLRFRFDLQSSTLGIYYKVGYISISKVENPLTPRKKLLIGASEARSIAKELLDSSVGDKILYVSPSGDDSALGTKDAPLATFNKALQLGASKILAKRGRYFSGAISNTVSNTGKNISILPYEDTFTTYSSTSRKERPLIEIVNGNTFERSQLTDSGLVSSTGEIIYYISIAEVTLRALNTYWDGIIDSYNPTNFVNDTNRGVSFRTGVYAFPLAFMDVNINANRLNIIRDEAHKSIVGYDAGDIVDARHDIFLDLFPQNSMVNCQANTNYTYTYNSSPKTKTPTASCFYDTSNGRLYMNFGTRTSLITALGNTTITNFLMKSGSIDTIDLQHYDSVDLQDIVVIGSDRNSFNLNHSREGRVFGCKSIISNGGNGFQTDYANLNFDWCDAYGSLNDGFNLHGFGTTVLESCAGAFNKDDGISHHDGCNGTIKNGVWTYNGKGGISSPTYGSITDIMNNLLAYNGYGVYSAIDSGNAKRSFKIANNLIKGNNYGVSVGTDTVCVGWNNIYVNNITNRGGTGTYTGYNDTDL